MSPATLTDAVVWQDVECGSYTDDLPLWAELAAAQEDDVLELGCGCGRVALALARLGHTVHGLDTDPALVEELRRRAAAEALPVHAERGDAAGFSLDRRFGLILAPMQLFQLLPGPAELRAALAATAAHLRPGGLAAIAIVDGAASGIPSSPPIPDVRERDGWVYSSLPLGVVEEGGTLVLERLRQRVSPSGHLDEGRDIVRLRRLSSRELEEEARAVGLHRAGSRTIGAGEAHVGSAVVLLEAGGR